jgi:hypothetical protein
LFRCWPQGDKPVVVRGLPTHFGDVDLAIQPTRNGERLTYKLKISPKGDQDRRELSKIVLSPRTADGRPIAQVSIDGTTVGSFTDKTVVIPRPSRGKEIAINVEMRQ